MANQMQQRALTGFEPASVTKDSGRTARRSSAASSKLDEMTSVSATLRRLLRSVCNRAIPSYELRKMTQIEQTLYEAQQKIEDPIIFTNWLKVAVGWCTWAPGPNGGIIPIASPSNYFGCTDNELREFLLRREVFIFSKHARNYLWGDLSESEQFALLSQIFPKKSL
jgi:hypothetical protein